MTKPATPNEAEAEDPSNSTASDTAMSEPTGPVQPSLKTLAIRSSAGTILLFVVATSCRMANSLILTRLLFPEVFGLMAMASTLLQGINMFSDVGLSASVLRHPRGEDQSFLDTVWTVSVIRGAILTVIACLLAYPASRFWFQQPSLGPVIVGLAFNSLIGGFMSPKVFTAVRRMNAGAMVTYDISLQISQFVLNVVIAYLIPSVWAVVIASLLANLFKVVLSFIVIPGQMNRFRMDREALSELTTFGRWIILNTSLNFFSNQGDRLLLGRIMGDTRFGIFSIAANLADLPVTIVTQLGYRMVMPVLTRSRSEGSSRLQLNYDRLGKWLNLAIVMGAAVVSQVGSTAVNALYDDRYVLAGPMLQLLAIRMLFACMNQKGLSLLLVMGEPRLASVGNVLKSLSMLICLPVGYRYAGTNGAMVAIGVAEFVMFLCIEWAVGRVGIRHWKESFKAFLPLPLGIGLGYLLNLALKAILTG